MHRSEVVVLESDKEELLKHILCAEKIIDKYPSKSCVGYDFLTTIARAQRAVHDAVKWIEYLHTDPNEPYDK